MLDSRCWIRPAPRAPCGRARRSRSLNASNSPSPGPARLPRSDRDRGARLTTAHAARRARARRAQAAQRSRRAACAHSRSGVSPLPGAGLLVQRAGNLLPAPTDRLNRLLGARDLRSGVEHAAIAVVVGIHRLGVRSPCLLELRLDPALAGQRRLQTALLVRDTSGVASRLLVEGAPLEGEMLGFELALRRLQLTELLGEGWPGA